MYIAKKILLEFISLFAISKDSRKAIRKYMSTLLNLDLERTSRNKRYLCKYTNIKMNKNLDCFTGDLPVWQLWLQGYDNSPQIVKNCINSVKFFCKNRKIILLTKDNLDQYVSLPEYITKKYNSGIISHTHFSDIVRIALLCEHGGTWIDSTVLLTGEIPKKILEAPLFMFSSSKDDFYYNTHLISSWFIHSSRKNNLLISLRDSLFSYWAYENSLRDYYLIHLIFRNIIDFSDGLKKEWDSLYHLSNNNPHILQSKLGDYFNMKEYLEVKELTFIHKLTYKFKPLSMKLDNNLTYWDFLSSDKENA
ncbi:capsular polysaccharide synthesis protein [Aggregatibacter actinomycetemcomitans]|uniref:capsular polysaccharide synthesis protein n=1 Tax=Aggregatibacter actinomycetemcomitans TaxID=714 RepID=UPI001F122323|nr:capsular polysaccharide synthesis protein [Aggregatibacter actinomycetemcomitans]